MTDIQVKYWQNKENERHNRQMERLTGQAQAEAARHNRAAEAANALMAQASYLQATTRQNESVANIALSNAREQETFSKVGQIDAQIAESNARKDLLKAQTPGATADSKLKTNTLWFDTIATGSKGLDAFFNVVGKVVSTIDSWIN